MVSSLLESRSGILPARTPSARPPEGPSRGSTTQPRHEFEDSSLFLVVLSICLSARAFSIAEARRDSIMQSSADVSNGLDEPFGTSATIRDVRSAIRLFIVFVVLAGLSRVVNTQTFDLVITNGRVLDPESGLDAVRDIGVTNGKIATLSAARLAGRSTIDASGLVVAPGFIDLHAHGQLPEI